MTFFEDPDRIVCRAKIETRPQEESIEITDQKSSLERSAQAY